jgi:hypothetical protein
VAFDRPFTGIPLMIKSPATGAPPDVLDSLASMSIFGIEFCVIDYVQRDERLI